MKVAESAADVDAEWMTQMFRAGGRLLNGRVVGVAARPIGAGMLGDSVLFTLEFAGEHDDVPSSVVGKFASPNAESRAFCARSGSYACEVFFYQQLAPGLPARVPLCYGATIDPETNYFTLILEDLTPIRPVDQLDGCSVEDAAKVLEQAARIHAHFWRSPRLRETQWLVDRTVYLSNLSAVYPQCIDTFEQRFSGLISPAEMKTCRDFASRCQAFYHRPIANETLRHTDMRLDNVLFDVQGGSDVAILDWQSLAIGSGALDVAFFIGTSLEVEERRAHERDLLAHYHDALQRAGVRDYGWDQLWEDYRLYACQGLSTSVIAAAVTKQTERSDAVFSALSHRAAAMVDDLRSLEIG